MTWVNFQTVREGLDFFALLDHYGFETKSTGRTQTKICCPFHEDANPSCGINLEKKVFNCFSCGAKGNVLDFFALMEGFDPTKPAELRKAALLAVETFGIDGGAQEAKSGNQPKAKARPVRGQKQPFKAVEPQAGSSTSEAAPENVSEPNAASDEVSDPVINPPLSFELKLDTKHLYLAEREVSKQLVADFGLGVAKKGSMKGRLCFPIHNEAGELIGYSGRWVEEDKPKDTPRYKLPKGFEKARVLFNLNRILSKREEGLATRTVVIVEGFWSVLRLHAAGIPVVASFGDSLSEAQVDLLIQAGIDSAVLIFDGDEAGRKGALAALPVLASRLFVKTVPLEDGIKPDTMGADVLASLPRYQQG